MRCAKPFARTGLARVVARAFSSESLVEVEQHTGYAVVSLGNAPVNTLTLPLINELKGTLETLAEDDHCNGVILTSSLPKIFTKEASVVSRSLINEGDFAPQVYSSLSGPIKGVGSVQVLSEPTRPLDPSPL